MNNTDALAKAFNFIHAAYPHLLDDFVKRVDDGESPADALLYLLTEDLAHKAQSDATEPAPVKPEPPPLRWEVESYNPFGKP